MGVFQYNIVEFQLVVEIFFILQSEFFYHINLFFALLCKGLHTED